MSDKNITRFKQTIAEKLVWDAQQAHIEELETKEDCRRSIIDRDIGVIMKLEARIEELEGAFKDAWPLMALKSQWLAKHPEHAETLANVIPPQETEE